MRKNRGDYLYDGDIGRCFFHGMLFLYVSLFLYTFTGFS